jgi:hypothetical protein
VASGSRASLAVDRLIGQQNSESVREHGFSAARRLLRGQKHRNGDSMPRMTRLVILQLPLLMGGIASVDAQAITDVGFQPTVGEAAFVEGRGPVVLVDEGHHNYRTIRPTLVPHRDEMMPGRYEPLARLLRRDGYVVRPLDGAFTQDALRDIDILIIGGAMAEATVDDFSLPTPAALSREEVDVLDSWVRSGGSLLVAAGTGPPAPAAVEDLAERFGVLFTNAIAVPAAFEADWTQAEWTEFRRSDRSLRDHPIIRGRHAGEGVGSVMTFGGQAFRSKPAADVQPLLVFVDPTVLIFEIDPFDPLEYAPRMRADGMLQAATVRHGSGRVALFGEEGMFSAYLTRLNGEPIGMNHPQAAQNGQFILNVFHWLSGLIPD